MNRFYTSLLVTVAALTLTAAAALAQITSESSPTCAGRVFLDLKTGVSTFVASPTNVQLAGDVYNNTNPAAPANFGISSTDLTSIWGDRVTTTGTGVLDQNDFTIYNSSSSAGPLLTVSFNIALYDAPSTTLLASYLTGIVNFGAGLPKGSYSIITVTGLSSLSDFIPSTDVLMIQQVATATGTANRLGIASLDPPSIGSSANTMYINSSTVGPAGYYTVGTSNANPGYRINLIQSTPTTKSTWGQLKSLYR